MTSPVKPTVKLPAHAPVPWTHFDGVIRGGNQSCVVSRIGNAANADLIVRAVNAHDRLVKALEYVSENHHEGSGEFNDVVLNALGYPADHPFR